MEQELFMPFEELKTYVIKKSGKQDIFDRAKIYMSIQKANETVEPTKQLGAIYVDAIAKYIERECQKYNRAMSTEEIGEMVERELSKHGCYEVTSSFVKYRYKKQLASKKNTIDTNIMSLIERENEVLKQENSNKNPIVNSVQRDYMAGEVSKDITRRYLLPEEIIKAHEEGIIHFHDEDYFIQLMHNCCLVNLEDMLEETVISETMIKKPKTFLTACNIATQAIAQIASSQYGGQTISIAHLIPFVDISRQKYIKEEIKNHEKLGISITREQAKELAEERVNVEIEKGVQTIQYQLITLMTTNGQAPFVSIYMDVDEVEENQKEDFVKVCTEILLQRIKGVQNEKGDWITPAFPKLLYVLTEENAKKGSKYYELTTLAAKCTAKRMVPDYISSKKMKELKNGDTYPCMGCRSFLTVDRFSNEKGNISNARNFEKHKGHIYYGRFNQGVVTLNLVDVACSSYGDEERFWEILDERLELCYKALMCRHKRLLGTPSDVAPILWQHGALARLEKGETIDKLLFDGYSTISLGYAGLKECTTRMTGVSHTNAEIGKPFALKVMKRLNDACAEWKEKENIDFSVYGTPLESTTYKFAKTLQKRFGIIKDVTDRNFITNSYHVHVEEDINAFEKLKFESEFQALSPGGAISYVEVPDMTDNIEAVLAVIEYIYENIMYAELNTKSDLCEKCGYEGEIKIVEDNGKLIWECPNCYNKDQNTMSVARRTCGYIGTQWWNQGRTAEIRARKLHLSSGKDTVIASNTKE